jgi:predicted membrane chloride channel (bestrophin family)
LYNEARPFRVLGGVSDVEMEQLCLARGPYAKVALCTKWLEEFISREHLAGSTGGVEPPIISRLYHFISEGMVGFNQCRKISYIPFPFPHAQLTILFIGVTEVVFPVLYYTYVNHLLFACILNFLTVMCFVGLHEVARELEQPFRNAPNGKSSS